MNVASRLAPAVLLVWIAACGPAGPKDPLAKVELGVRVFEENQPTSNSVQLAKGADAGTSWSNRPVSFVFNNLNTLNKTDSLVTKVEVTRVSNGQTTTCAMLDEQGAVFAQVNDWAGATTEYTFTVTGTTTSKTFGPVLITVQSAARVVTGSHDFGDQTNDAITSGGSFFQSRSVDIGTGGYSGPNFNTTLAHNGPRLIDFEVVSVGMTPLKAISPSDIKANHDFPLLTHDCGYQTTTFAAYTGPLDPKAAPLTVAEVEALPSPPASGTSMPLTLGLKFVYQTSDGKKGLVRVDTLVTGTTMNAGLVFSSEQ